MMTVVLNPSFTLNKMPRRELNVKSMRQAPLNVIVNVSTDLR